MVRISSRVFAAFGTESLVFLTQTLSPLGAGSDAPCRRWPSSSSSSGRDLFRRWASGADRAVNALPKGSERLQDAEPAWGQCGAPLRTFAGHRARQCHAENALCATDVFPGVAIRPANIVGRQRQRTARVDRKQKPETAVAHDEPTAVVRPHLRLRLDGYVWPFLLIAFRTASALLPWDMREYASMRAHF
jgi:hypothetical protein